MKFEADIEKIRDYLIVPMCYAENVSRVEKHAIALAVFLPEIRRNHTASDS